MIKTFEQLAQEHKEWAFSTFPKCTSIGALLHAHREIDETISEINEGNPNRQLQLITEYADVFGCIIDSLHREGFAISEMLEAFDNKLQINKTRQWKDNGDGSYSHVKHIL